MYDKSLRQEHATRACDKSMRHEVFSPEEQCTGIRESTEVSVTETEVNLVYDVEAIAEGIVEDDAENEVKEDAR